jgi:hypothetical protein
MTANVESSPAGLSPAIEQLIADLIKAAKKCFQEDLKSIVLFGSGAEGRLRKTFAGTVKSLKIHPPGQSGAASGGCGSSCGGGGGGGCGGGGCGGGCGGCGG